MAGYPASTSGRGVWDSGSASLARTGIGAAPHRPAAIRTAGRGALLCRAISLPHSFQLVRVLHQLFRAPQEQHTLLLEDEAQASCEGPCEGVHQQLPFAQFLRQTTYAAIHLGLRLTGLAVQLARTVVDDMRRSVRVLSFQQQVQREAAAARKVLDTETMQNYARQRAKLQQQGQDAGFMQMLHTLDCSDMDLEAKWALVQKHTADKADFSEHLRRLYAAARESKEAVETLLRPTASRIEVNQFWKSEQTATLIAEEEALKQLVFAQVLQGCTP